MARKSSCTGWHRCESRLGPALDTIAWSAPRAARNNTRDLDIAWHTCNCEHALRRRTHGTARGRMPGPKRIQFQVPARAQARAGVRANQSRNRVCGLSRGRSLGAGQDATENDPSIVDRRELRVKGLNTVAVYSASARPGSRSSVATNFATRSEARTVKTYQVPPFALYRGINFFDESQEKLNPWRPVKTVINTIRLSTTSDPQSHQPLACRVRG
jgi:hypothetical protein